jgi:DNA mismatch repair protein MutL
MLRDFLSQAGRNKVSTSLSDFIDKICAQMACHGSVRAGQALSHDQIDALLKQLDEIDYHAHCPHGRPTTKVVPYTELAKWFHRM